MGKVVIEDEARQTSFGKRMHNAASSMVCEIAVRLPAGVAIVGGAEHGPMTEITIFSQASRPGRAVHTHFIISALKSTQFKWLTRYPPSPPRSPTSPQLFRTIIDKSKRKYHSVGE